jgi:hypothetical protein
MFLSPGYSLLRAEGYKFFPILGHQTLDPDPQLQKMMDPNPDLH